MEVLVGSSGMKNTTFILDDDTGALCNWIPKEKQKYKVRKTNIYSGLAFGRSSPSSPSISMTLTVSSLDVNVAVALRIWPGCINHICWPGEVVFSGIRR